MPRQSRVTRNATWAKKGKPYYRHPVQDRKKPAIAVVQPDIGTPIDQEVAASSRDRDKRRLAAIQARRVAEEARIAEQQDLTRRLFGV